MKTTIDITISRILIVLLLTAHYSCLSVLQSSFNDDKIAKSAEDSNNIKNYECQSTNLRRYAVKDVENTDDDDAEENEDSEDDGNYNFPNKIEAPTGADRDVHRQVKRTGRIIRQGPKIWDHWSEWSNCTVTCGVGKLMRWRNCIGGSCSQGRQPKVWDQWGKWSCCNTSCGPGKLTRWRHCISGGCASGEKEAQRKSCHLKSC